MLATALHTVSEVVYSCTSGTCRDWLTLVDPVVWLQLCVEGPKEKLDSTVYSQPAIYVASLAAVEKLKATEGQVGHKTGRLADGPTSPPAAYTTAIYMCVFTPWQAAIDAIDVACGLSLGEYTALAFAGAMR
jgi:[acyl-carrier-protein] S-malonyltransferase